MNKFYLFTLFFLTVLFLTLSTTSVQGQEGTVIRRPGSNATPNVRYDSQGRVIPNAPNSQGQDSLKHRDNTEDSITIYYRFFDSTRIRYLDSSINDFTSRFPLPADYVTLGNFGTAAHSLVFNPNLQAGFDPGFHAFDIYRFTIRDTRFYQTTRPYSQLGYMLGSKGEQMINLVHTQNIKPNFNMAFQYRLINSPGNLQNQNTSHNSYRINGNYQSRNKRYSAYGIYLVNKLNSSESGGIQDNSFLKNESFSDRFTIPTRLGGDSNLSRNPFSTKITTGNIYAEKVFMYRHQYDFGQSDSLVVNDSTVIRLFYPRFRLQHTLTYSSQQFEFRDLFTGATKRSDYLKYFGAVIPGDTGYTYSDSWTNINNDFSIVSFPEKNNLNQFIKTGVSYELLSGNFGLLKEKFHNIYFNGEYRNRTRNQKWDLSATGKFYLTGLNSGVYSAQANLRRLISKKIGYLDLGFLNVNRTPSFI
ncbi:MAG TPA: putative porin, partial [Segetibacter sp.]